MGIFHKSVRDMVIINVAKRQAMADDTSEDKPLLTSDQSQLSDSGSNYEAEERHVTFVNHLPFYDEDDDDDIDNQHFLVSGHHIEDEHQPTSNCETLTHMIKGNLGTGILAMPDALKNSGLYTGLGLLPVLAIMCIHCMHSLVRCQGEIKIRIGNSNLDYADVGEQAFKTGPPSIQKFSVIARKTINMFIVVTQMGFCCIYVVFISANIKDVIDIKFPEATPINLHGYMAIVFVFLLFIVMIRSLKLLAPLSMISNLFLFLGLGICFYYILQDLPPSFDRKQFSSWGELPLFLGTSIYAFEGIGIVLPLERNMAHPQDFRGYNGVLNTAMVSVTCSYIALGFFGYLKYGDIIQGSITLNLPATDNLAQLVKILMALAIYLTYPLMMHVPAQIIWPHFKTSFVTRTSRRRAEYAFRALLVAITFGFAAAIPNIGLFISLVGAMSSSTLALIFPPIIELVTFWFTMGRISKAKCFIISLFGIFCFVVGSYASLKAIIGHFSQAPVPVPDSVS